MLSHIHFAGLATAVCRMSLIRACNLFLTVTHRYGRTETVSAELAYETHQLTLTGSIQRIKLEKC